MKDYCTVEMLIACFKDHKAFEGIVHKNTLVRDLMFHEMFLKKEDDDQIFKLTMSPPTPTKKKLNNIEQAMKSKFESTEAFLSQKVFIPHLILLGLLYCQSNRQQRASKFYELVEIDLSYMMEKDDPEFLSYIPVMHSICYDLMTDLYNKHELCLDRETDSSLEEKRK
jgi:hypothetical protein